MGEVRRGLERLARSLAASSTNPRASPRSKLQHDLSVALERLEDLRSRMREGRRTLLRQECELETELGQLLNYRPRVYLHEGRVRARLQRAVLDLRRERRTLYSAYSKDQAALQDEVFRLLWQCFFLTEAGP